MSVTFFETETITTQFSRTSSFIGSAGRAFIRLSYHITSNCSIDTYGPTCDTICRSSGTYYCNYLGVRVCDTGYYPPGDCSQYCSSSSCSGSSGLTYYIVTGTFVTSNFLIFSKQAKRISSVSAFDQLSKAEILLPQNSWHPQYSWHCWSRDKTDWSLRTRFESSACDMTETTCIGKVMLNSKGPLLHSLHFAAIICDGSAVYTKTCSYILFHRWFPIPCNCSDDSNRYPTTHGNCCLCVLHLCVQ